MLQILIPPALLVETANGLTEEGTARKVAVHREGKSFLSKLGASLGHIIGAYTVRSNQGSPAVCGEVTLQSEDISLQLHKGFIQPGLSLSVTSCTSSFDLSGAPIKIISMGDLVSESAQEGLIALLAASIRNEQARKHALKLGGTISSLR